MSFCLRGCLLGLAGGCGTVGRLRGSSWGGGSSRGSCLIMGIGKNGSGKMAVVVPPDAIVRLGALMTMVEEEDGRRLLRLGVRTGVRVTLRFIPLARDSILLAIAGVMFLSWGILVGVVAVVTIGENLVNDMALGVGVDGLAGVVMAVICSA
uniref:(northern house mosquito) hypothetical protein n=1 Tax=Culex pipiens TaxID=7175 RepID=A0A8D8CW16_CULPI